MASSQNAEETAVPIEMVEHSINHLPKSFNRRKKWRIIFLTSTNPNQDFDIRHTSWRTYLVQFLDSSPVRLLTLFLLLCDLVLTVLELSSTLLSCSMRQNKVGKFEAWFHWASVSLLGLLCVRSMGIAVGGGLFFRRPGYLVDGAVILVALALEVFFEKKGGGLLVMVSLWRVLRIVESVFEISDEAIETQIEVITRELEGVKKENIIMMDDLVKKDKIILEL